MTVTLKASHQLLGSPMLLTWSGVRMPAPNCAAGILQHPCAAQVRPDAAEKRTREDRPVVVGSNGWMLPSGTSEDAELRRAHKELIRDGALI